jgi:hypothetical protein
MEEDRNAKAERHMLLFPLFAIPALFLIAGLPAIIYSILS